MRRLSLIVTLLALVSAPALARWSDDCEIEKPMREVAPTTGIARIEVDARAGSLEITGSDDVTQLEAEAVACASDEKMAQAVRWGTERRGDVLYVFAETPAHRDNQYARLNLKLRVPAGMDLDVSDTSGAVTISGAGSLRLRDSSGSIEIVRAAGAVLIDDSSGSIDVRNIGGPVEIRDGSGSITVRDVRHSLRIVDGSGSITVDNVDGDVEVERDGSGSVSVADVGGNFVVGRDGSGAISHRRVAGKVSLPRD